MQSTLIYFDETKKVLTASGRVNSGFFILNKYNISLQGPGKGGGLKQLNNLACF